MRTVISPHGSAAETLRTIAREHSLIASLHVLSELYDVLRRPRIRKLHKLRDRQIRRVISRFYKLVVLVPVPSAMPITVPKDPQDHPVVMTAIAGKAEVLCTLDHHLHEAEVVALCASHGIRVLRDAELLTELRAG